MLRPIEWAKIGLLHFFNRYYLKCDNKLFLLFISAFLKNPIVLSFFYTVKNLQLYSCSIWQKRCIGLHEVYHSDCLCIGFIRDWNILLPESQNSVRLFSGREEARSLADFWQLACNYPGRIGHSGNHRAGRGSIVDIGLVHSGGQSGTIRSASDC